MGLDATVYCDCWETGKVRKAPPQPELVYVEASGQVSLKWDAPEADQQKFYNWLAEACDHGPLGELISCRLGNFALIGLLRERLAETPERFPLLLNKVLYDFGHCGDHLTLDEVNHLVAEVESLKTVVGRGTDEVTLVRRFERQMFELIEAAKMVGKPISF